MILSFRRVSIAASALCFLLALTWILFPQLFFWMWQTGASEAASVVGRRGGALFLALGVTLFMAKDAAPSPTRRSISIGMSVGCAILALLGAYDFFVGNVGFGIIAAILVEIALSTAFGIVAQRETLTKGEAGE